MKKVILMRHAEAESINDKGDCFRILTKKGQEQARSAANFLSQYQIDKVIVSPAIRTQQTLDIILDKIHIKNIQESMELYEREKEDIIDIICNQDTKINNILIIGHNPTIHAVALQLVSNDIKLINFYILPANIIVISIDCLDCWSDLGIGLGTVEKIFSNSH